MHALLSPVIISQFDSTSKILILALSSFGLKQSLTKKRVSCLSVTGHRIVDVLKLPHTKQQPENLAVCRRNVWVVCRDVF